MAGAEAMSPLPVNLDGGVVLRHYELTDLDALWSAIEEERARLAVWMPFLRDAKTIADERGWLESVTAEPRGLGGASLWRARELLGGVGLFPDSFGIVAEIGYWIRTSEEGRGHVTRACRALIGIAFRELGLHRVVIRAGVENRRSRAVPERLGFTYEGIAREEGRGSGGFYDLAVYGLLDREWNP
jgi:ribosomal-protein-serine acetyltransferase